MIRTLFITENGMVAAFDADGKQLPQFQGYYVPLLISTLISLGATDEATEFNYLDQDGGLMQLTGAQIAAGVAKVQDRQG